VSFSFADFAWHGGANGRSDLGTLAAKAEARPVCFMAVGETGSERACCLPLERLAPLSQEAEPPSSDARCAIVEQFAVEISVLARRMG